MIFDKLTWKEDRMLLDDLVFRIEWEDQEYGRNWDLGDACFRFYKYKWLVDEYARYWSTREHFRPRNVFEIGIWDGASTVLWNEYFRPEKLVAIDRGGGEGGQRQGTPFGEDSAYFKHYLLSRGLRERIRTYWGVDQADAARLREIVAAEFDGPLDLVIDDGSHRYGPTRASFEVLFPLLRPGGLYLIEDWSWSHCGWAQAPDDGYAGDTPLTNLIVELLEAVGSFEKFMPGGALSSLRTVMASLSVLPAFAIVERGAVSRAELDDFVLDRHILRRPQDRPYGHVAPAAWSDLQAQFRELQASYAELYTRHVPLTYLSGLLRATSGAALQKMKRTLFGLFSKS